MKNLFFYLLLLVLVSCTNEVVDELPNENSVSIESRDAGTNLQPNEWGIQNMTQSGRYVDYELVYKNTKTDFTYFCSSLYTMILYKGAYDGYYGGYSIDWKYNSTFGLYFPEEIPAEYGLCVREFDACDGENGLTFAPNVTRTRSGSFQLPVGKTLADIEYVLFFIYDNKRGDRYVDTWDFYSNVEQK